MPQRCVAANCSNVASGSVRLFSFPREEKLRKQWVSQVGRTRADWSGPTTYSRLCSEHFGPDCFDHALAVRDALGYGFKCSRNICPTAVPTIFRRGSTDSPPVRKSKAVEKRERLKVLETLLDASPLQEKDSDCGPTQEKTSERMETAGEDATDMPSSPLTTTANTSKAESLTSTSDITSDHDKTAGTDKMEDRSTLDSSQEERYLQQPVDHEMDVSSVDETESVVDDGTPLKKRQPGLKVKLKIPQKIKRKSIPVIGNKEDWVKPFSHGWHREVVLRNTYGELSNKPPPADIYYRSPTGKKLRSRIEIDAYLEKNPDEPVGIECFTFVKEAIYREPFETVRHAGKAPGHLITYKSDSEAGSPKPAPLQKRKRTQTDKNSPLRPKKKLKNGNKTPKGTEGAKDCKVEKTSESPVVAKPEGNNRGRPGKLCSMECPGRKGIPPSLHCDVCMCVFHPECAKYDRFKSTSIFVCKTCSGDKKRDTASSKSQVTAGPGFVPPTVNPYLPPPPRLKAAPKMLKTIGSLHSIAPETPIPKFDSNVVAVNVDPAANTGLGQGQARTVFVTVSKAVPIQPSVHPISASALPTAGSTPTASSTPKPLPPINKSPGDWTVSQMLEMKRQRPSKSVGVKQADTVAPLNVNTSAVFKLLTDGKTGTAPASAADTSSLTPISSTKVARSGGEANHLSPPPPAASPLPDPVAGPTSGGQLITLPTDITKKLDLGKPLCLKVGNVKHVVPPSCFVVMAEGIKVLLPAGTLPPTSDSRLEFKISNTASDPMQKVIGSEAGSNVKAVQKAALNSKVPSTKSKDSNPGICTISNLHGGFEAMLLIFKHLSLSDLLRASQVCHTWQRVASLPTLWKEVRLRDHFVGDWRAAFSHISRCYTASLDLRGMTLGKDAGELWKEFASQISHLGCLRHVNLSECPAFVVHSVADKWPSLISLSASVTLDESGQCLDCAKLPMLRVLEEFELRESGSSVIMRSSLPELAKLPQLHTLSLSGLVGRSSDEFEFIGLLVNLKSLEIGDCTNWSDTVYQALGKLTNLELLRLECGRDPPELCLGEVLALLPKLTSLALIRYDISEKTAQMMHRLSQLEVLSLWPQSSKMSQVNSNTLLSVSGMDFLQRFDWGIVTDSKSDDHIPFMSSVTQGGEGMEGEETSVAISDLVKKICHSLPQTSIRVFRVPSASVSIAMLQKL